jgi:hypothetical protein
MSANRYSVLEVEDVSVTDTLKKAVKKLKEIERLKQKMNPSPEEIAKLNTESFWRNIVSPKPSHRGDSDKKNTKHMRKEAARLEKERKERREQYVKKFKHITDEFELEFCNMMHETNYDVNKTFRLLSFKYHPDKNIGKKEWAEAKQKLLLDCKEKFASYCA